MIKEVLNEKGVVDIEVSKTYVKTNNLVVELKEVVKDDAEVLELKIDIKGVTGGDAQEIIEFISGYIIPGDSDF